MVLPIADGLTVESQEPRAPKLCAIAKKTAMALARTSIGKIGTWPE